MGTREEREAVRGAIRSLLAADRARRAARSREHYKDLFPGFWDLVDEECDAVGPSAGDPTRLQGGTSSAPAAPAPAPAEERIGPYRILSDLGRGGMGVVYLAEDTRLARRVALKVLPAHFASSPQLLARFRREAELASKLDHRSICTVYEAGESDGTPWMAMRLLDGRPLSDWVARSREERPSSGVVSLPAVEGRAPEEGPARDERRQEIDRILVLVEEAARALHAAHEAGLVHRDIKPHNIMVTAGGEPVLLDFGLAREEDGDAPGMTRTGALMGTPAYLSPEQLAAQRIRIDRRTDVYSLGVTLYECLTLRLPFEAPTLDALYQKILMTDPEGLRRVNPAIPRDLEVVVATAMARDRERRYRSALDLAEDLRRVRRDEPIRARPVGPAERFRRWAQRNPAVASSVTLAFLFLGIGLGFAVHHWRRADVFLKDAEFSAKTASAALLQAAADGVERSRALSESRANLRTARALALASASAVEGRRDPMAGLLLAREAARRDPRPDVLLRLHEALADSPERVRMPLPSGLVRSFALTPDEKHVVAATTDGDVVLFDLAGRQVRRLQGPGEGKDPLGNEAIFAPGPMGPGFEVSPADGRILCWTYAAAEVWDPAAGTSARRAAVAGERILDGRWTPDGPRILCGKVEGGGASVRDLEGRAVLECRGGRDAAAHGRLLPGSGGVVTVAWKEIVLFDAGGRVLASRQWEESRMRFVLVSSAGAVLGMADTNQDQIAGELLWLPDGRSIPAPERLDRRPSFSPDGSRLVYEDWPKGLHVLDMSTGVRRPLANGLNDTGGFAPGGERLLAQQGAGFADRLGLFDVEGERVVDFPGIAGVIYQSRFTQDRGHVWSGSSDDRLRVWDLEGRLAADLPLAAGGTGIHVLRGGRRILAAQGKSIRLLDLDGGEAACLREEDRGSFGAAVFLPDGRRILTTDYLGNGVLWGLGGERQVDFPVKFRGTGVVTNRRPWLTPDGRSVLLDHYDGKARLWTLDGKETSSFSSAGQAMDLLALSPDGSRVAAVCDGGLILWTIEGNQVARIPREGSGVQCLSFSPTGNRLATMTHDGRVALWDERGARTCLLPETAGFGGGYVRWCPTGDRILVLGANGASLWSPEGRKLRALGGPGLKFHDGGFLPGGDAVLTGHQDGVGRLWDLEGNLQATFSGEWPAASPDGGRVTTQDDQVHLWERSGRRIASFPRREEGIQQTVISPDGKLLLTMENRRAYLWLVDLQDLLALADARVTRDFTPEERAKHAEILEPVPEGGK